MASKSSVDTGGAAAQSLNAGRGAVDLEEVLGGVVADHAGSGANVTGASTEYQVRTPSDEMISNVVGDNGSISIGIDYARSIARGVMTEALLSDNVKALQHNPELLLATLDEFAAETDPTRLDRLRLVLGQLDDLSLVAAAQGMIFSGNPASADAGLDLLRDIGPRVPEARNVALDVLSSTQDPDMLVGATNVMVVVSSDDPEVAQRVVSSLSSLVQHPDARVRRASYSTLARWSQDPSVTPTLLQGLTDVDPKVRKSTAYGFVGYPNADSTVIEALLGTAENESDIRRARLGALLALRDMPLDESQQVRLQALQQELY